MLSVVPVHEVEHVEKSSNKLPEHASSDKQDLSRLPRKLSFEY